MKWRKINRILHRDLGYFFFGMTIIYSVSGIVLNHKRSGGDASIVTRTESFQSSPVSRESVDKDYIIGLLTSIGEDEGQFKNYFFPQSEYLTVYLKNGHVNLDLATGEGSIIKIRQRPVLYEFNFLHYNKPKKLWTWFSDIFAASLGIIAITGLFILKGKNGITRRGAYFTGAGIIVPLLFLMLYLWF